MTILSSPASLTATHVVTNDISAGHCVEARTALTLVRIQLTLGTSPLWQTLTVVAGQHVSTRTRVKARVRRTLVNICHLIMKQISNK